MTPFYKKSEFWVSLCTGATGLLMCCGVFSKEEASALCDAFSQLVGAIMAIASTIKYASTAERAREAVFRELCEAGRHQADIAASTGARAASSMSETDNVVRSAMIAGI